MSRVVRRSRMTACALIVVGQCFAALPAAAAPPATPAAPAPAAPASPSAPAAPATPGAPSDEALREAAQHYDRGLALYADGEHALAAIEFDRAYEVVPDYRVLHNIGQVRIQLGQYAKARRALERYKREGGSRISAERRASLEADLAIVTARTATLAIATNVEKADILVDDEVIGTSPLAEPLLLDAGEHHIGIRKAGYQQRVIRQALAGRDNLRVRIDLDPIPGMVRVPVAPTPVEPSSRPTLRWIAWSTTGALAAATAITGGLGIKAVHDLADLRETKGVSSSALQSKEKQANSMLLAADVLGGAAIAGTGIALYLTFAPDKAKRPPTQLGLSVSPTWFGATVRY